MKIAVLKLKMALLSLKKLKTALCAGSPTFDAETLELQKKFIKSELRASGTVY